MTMTHVKASILMVRLLTLAVACGKNSESTSAPWFVGGRWRGFTSNKQIELPAEPPLPFKLAEPITLK